MYETLKGNSLTCAEITPRYVEDIVENALREDIGPGDISTNFLIPEGKEVKAYLRAKENGIICGLHVAEVVFKKMNVNIKWNSRFEDGAKVEKGNVVALIEGSYKVILTGERTALNFLQRLSGIATRTNQFVETVKQTKTKILDTRKTVPGLRLLDKYAVRTGGGTSHRIGLFDMVMVKDNHIKVAGGITNAVNKIKENIDSKTKIEVETSTLDEVREAMNVGVDIIMLDNMSTEEMYEAVKLINRKAQVEASGNMTLERVKEVAETGVDFISVGELTHSVKALDIGLYIDN